MQTSAKKACFQFAECSFSSAKKMQTSAKKVLHFNLPEC
ncbi:biotin synthase, partial [Segatella copri]